MEPGWHIYALTTPAGGPTPTTIKAGRRPRPHQACKLYQPKPTVKFDPNFNLNVEAFEGAGHVPSCHRLIRQGCRKARPRFRFSSAIRRARTKSAFPAKRTLTAEAEHRSGAAAAEFAMPAGYTEFTGQRSPASAGGANHRVPATRVLRSFLLVAFGFGLAAIFTPCVFPMIPITLSFFLNKPGALRQAILFCLGIIVMFSAMGLLVTAAARSVRRRAAWIESVGERVYRRWSLSSSASACWERSRSPCRPRC